MNLSKYFREEDDSAENKFTKKYKILEDQEKYKKIVNGFDTICNNNKLFSI